MKPYEVVFTRLGRAIAETHYSIAAVEAEVRRSVEVHKGGENSVDGLAFMTVTIEEIGPNARPFVVMCIEPGVLMVDSATFEETEPMTDGPFKGQTLMMAVPDSMDRDDFDATSE